MPSRRHTTIGTYEHHVEHHHVVDHDEQAACRRAQKLGVVTVGDALTYYPFRVAIRCPAGTARGPYRRENGVLRVGAQHAGRADERSAGLPARGRGG